jgi:hypothetical protein
VADPIDGGWRKEHDELARAAGFESWTAWIAELENVKYKGRKLCGGMAGADDDRPCEAGAGKGTEHRSFGRCMHHGGCSPALRGGLPVRLLEAAAEEATDVELVTVQREIGYTDEITVVLHAEMMDLAGNAQLRGPSRAVLVAVKADDASGLQTALGALEQTLGAVDRLLLIRGELESNWDLKRRLVETELKIEVNRHDMMSRKRLGAFIGRQTRVLGEALDRHVDEETRRIVLLEFVSGMADMLTGPSGGNGGREP